jgi:hypothetical protein
MTIDLKKLADEMKRLGYKGIQHGHSFSDWTYTLVDALEALYGLETKLAKVFLSLDKKAEKE